MTLSKGFAGVFQRDEGRRLDRPTVLLVDDEPGVLLALRELLGDAYHVLSSQSGADALKILSEHDVAVIVSDQRMPAMSGSELLEAAREQSPETVRVLITGYADLGAVIDAVNRGQIYFYLSKPWNTGEIEGVLLKAAEHWRIRRERQSLVDELSKAKQSLEHQVAERTKELEERNRELEAVNQELEAANRRAEELARRDPLTGALNRRALDEMLTLEVERSGRQALPISAILLDVDHFKRVNDTCGHSMGDSVLIAVAQALVDHLRPYDLVARFGGEEFVVVLPGTGLEAAVVVAERLRNVVSSIFLEGLTWPVTASFGVAEWHPQDSLERWISRSDRAMYDAKAAGRNRVVSEKMLADEPTAPGED